MRTGDIASDPRLQAVADEQRYPLLFMTISGAHLYGFPSADSDFDLRGVHLLPAREVVGLRTGPETLQLSRPRDGLDIDLVTHDVKKFFDLLLKKNGYVLEQLYSPLVVRTTPEHAEVQAIARRCITRHHAHHYLGFSRGEWERFQRTQPRPLKALLYVYRVLLTGIHLMRTGEVEANLVRLNEVFTLPYIAELVALKQERGEWATLDEVDLAFHQREYERLRQLLEEVHMSSALPDGPRRRTRSTTSSSASVYRRREVASESHQNHNQVRGAVDPAPRGPLQRGRDERERPCPCGGPGAALEAFEDDRQACFGLFFASFGAFCMGFHVSSCGHWARATH